MGMSNVSLRNLAGFQILCTVVPASVNFRRRRRRRRRRRGALLTTEMQILPIAFQISRSALSRRGRALSAI